MFALLMLADDGAGREEDPSDPADRDREGNTLFTILVVDNKFRLHDALDVFLRSRGYSFVVAESAEQALKMTRRFEPDLILLDCELKGLNCLSLLPELLLLEPKVAVILMASRPQVSNVVEALRMGAVDFFERPLNLERLEAAIEAQKRMFG